MSKLGRLLGPVMLPFLAFVALADTGCASSIAARHPHLERRAVCVRPQEIEVDSSEFVFAEGNVPISNLHPEVVDRVAPTARTVYEVELDADPSSPKYLPAPYNELTCPERFKPLPSLDEVTRRIPAASLDLVVHERHPEPVSKALAEELAKCSSHITGQVSPGQYAMQINAYVRNDGQTVAAFVTDSTFKDRKLIGCVAKILRSTQWSPLPTSGPNVAVAPLALKGLMAQAEPAQPLPDSAPESGIRRIQPQPFTPPANAPTGTRIPRIFVIPLGPIAAAVALFGIIYFWSDNDAPAWTSEMNPITRQPYTSRWEYDEIRLMTPEQIREAQIKATQSQTPPAPTLTPEQQREQEKKAQQCLKIAKDIWDLIYTVRAETTGSRADGYQGLAKRWWEHAMNIGKWGPKPDGSMGKNQENHIKEYEKHQRRLQQKLDREWKEKGCDEKDLPHLARQYAAQKPELGPGKPLEPGPTPTWPLAGSPVVIAPKDTTRP